MKKIILTNLFLALFATAFSQTYSKVKIYLQEHSLQEIGNLGVTVDHGHVKKGVYIETDISETEIQLLKQNNIPFDVVVKDVAKFYEERNINAAENEKSSSNCGGSGITYPTPQNFQLGSMGGFFTYQEILDNLDSMAAKYPNLVSARQPIGTFQTHENRPIYWLKISDNPNTDEPEPEILFTALHHAREPASVSQMIMFMWYMLENYASNNEIQQLLDNTEIYFIPCVNPDGYIYNETTNPNGGGMWRKNRRNNNDGTYGVDLNRNYGYMWGIDNTGSSPNTNSDTYRGPSAFSEPETQAVKYFEENHTFGICVNYHTYGNLLIYPWGYAPSIYTPDSAVFVEYAQLMTRYNNYTYGTGDQTVGYITNGDSDDWGYGEQSTKNKVFSMTPEAGDNNDGFWPVQSRIIDICKSNIYQNLMAVKLVGKYAKTTDISSANFSSLNNYLKFNVKRLGLDSPATFTISLQPLTANIGSVGSSKSFSGMALLEERIDSISFTLNSNIQTGDIVKFLLITDNGLYQNSDTITHIYGTNGGQVVFDNGNTISNWSPSSGWGTTTAEYYSPSSSITDSPNGNYGNNVSSDITLNTSIDLSQAITANVTFWAKWSIENDYDYVEFQVSADGGNTWTPMCGNYTNTGTSSQDAGQPLYDGIQATWVQEQIDLSDYLGMVIQVKFVFQSDYSVNDDGFYFDDFTVTALTPTGVKQWGEVAAFSIYPNPLHDNMFVVNNLQEKATLSLFDVSGREVAHYNLIGGKQHISLNIPSGLYFYTIVSGNGTSIQSGKLEVVK